jgi:hypothetical protein
VTAAGPVTDCDGDAAGGMVDPRRSRAKACGSTFEPGTNWDRWDITARGRVTLRNPGPFGWR